MPFVPTQTLWACELSIYGLLALAALADLAQRQKNLLKRIVSQKSHENPVSFFDLQRTSDCAVPCTRKRTKNEQEACRKIRYVSLRFGPRSWPTTDRLAVKKSLTPQTVRETHPGQSFIHSINQPINLPTNSIWSRCIPTPARPVGPGTDATRDPNQTSSTAPTSNPARVRTIVSRCRGRLTFCPRILISRYGPSMGQRQCLVLRLLRAGAVAPLAPLKWIS